MFRLEGEAAKGGGRVGDNSGVGGNRGDVSGDDGGVGGTIDSGDAADDKRAAVTASKQRARYSINRVGVFLKARRIPLVSTAAVPY